MTELEAKTLLLNRLDDCLIAHAESITIGGPPAIKDIYEMQYLSEIHYYLKVEHSFTPAEVEALLHFKDPLNVARWCREENTHEYSFPICELLNKVNAYDRFEEYPQTPSLKEKEMELTKLLSQNYYAYMEEIESLSAPALLERCTEIAATMAAYKFMTEEYTLTREAADYLLRFDNPLELIRSYWPDGALYGEDTMETLLDDIRTPQEERSDTTKSVRERLQNAVREVKDRPRPTPKSEFHDAGAL